ncbi:MAG: hypothetical protein ACK559_07685, partial [bacterium]
MEADLAELPALGPELRVHGGLRGDRLPLLLLLPLAGLQRAALVEGHGERDAQHAELRLAAHAHLQLLGAERGHAGLQRLLGVEAHGDRDQLRLALAELHAVVVAAGLAEGLPRQQNLVLQVPELHREAAGALGLHHHVEAAARQADLDVLHALGLKQDGGLLGLGEAGGADGEGGGQQGDRAGAGRGRRSGQEASRRTATVPPRAGPRKAPIGRAPGHRRDIARSSPSGPARGRLAPISRGAPMSRQHATPTKSTPSKGGSGGAGKAPTSARTSTAAQAPLEQDPAFSNSFMAQT